MCDRTSDFRSIVEAQRKYVLPTTIERQQNKDEQQSQFTTAAAAISRDIHTTANKIVQLTRLVQRKSLFDDPTTEINRLVHDIKQDITGLNGQLENAQEYVSANSSRKGGGKQLVNHSKNVVGNLKTELALRANEFKGALQTRNENMKAQQNRRGQYGLEKPSPLGRPLVYSAPISRALNASGSPLPRPSGVGAPPGAAGAAGGVSGVGPPPPMASPLASTSTAGANGSMVQYTTPPHGGGDGGGGAGITQRYQAYSAARGEEMQALLVPNQSYLEERANAMTDIESHIVDLGQVFGKLATMIHEQQEMVERIDDNVDEALDHSNRAREQLMKYLTKLQSNRPLVLKTFGVLMAFIIFFLVFLA